MTGPLTPERKQGIRERIAAATEGPWFLADSEHDNSIEVLCADIDGEDTPVLEIFSSIGSETVDANWAFVAASRTDLPDLHKSHEALVEALQRVRGWLGAGSRADEEVAIGILDSALRNAGVTL